MTGMRTAITVTCLCLLMLGAHLVPPDGVPTVDVGPRKHVPAVMNPAP